MDRLKKLIQDHTYSTIKESDREELVTLLIKDRNKGIEASREKGEVVKYYGEQLEFIRRECDLLKIDAIKSNIGKRTN